MKGFKTAQHCFQILNESGTAGDRKNMNLGFDRQRGMEEEEGEKTPEQRCSSKELKKYYKILIRPGGPSGGWEGIFQKQKEIA